MPTSSELVPSPRYELSRWLFLRLLALVYLIAFASLAPQLRGLVGEQGLLPAADLLDRAGEFYGAAAYYEFPTLAWLGPGDAGLLAICWAGILLALAAGAGVAPVLTFALLWVLYLSLTVAGQTFLAFQWDTLLLETGLLACLYAPLGWLPRLAVGREPVAAARWLVWALCLLYTSPSPRDGLLSRMPSSA